MAIQQRKRAVGTFPNLQNAEEALSKLKDSGFPMNRVSVLAKNTDRGDQIAGATVKDKSDITDRGDTEAQEGAGIGAVTGTVLGGIGGLLVGLEALIIPGVGPFLAAGTVATTLAGAGIGAATGGLVGALTGLGIPEEEARAYGQRVSQGEILVIVDGSDGEIERAGSILRNQDIRNWAIYN
ncbi:MAG: general stress protein, partial [Fischerella sp.]|nr:general stress protein [Fischerella sp.]